jgi:hypothetical protein
MASSHRKAEIRSGTKKGGANGRPLIPAFAGMTHFFAPRFQRAGKCVT